MSSRTLPGLVAAALVAVLVPAGLAFAAGASDTVQGAAPAKVSIKLAVWDYSVAPEYKETIDAFQKANPAIAVEPLEISSKEYSDKLTIMLAGGDTTDVLAMKDMPSYSGYVMRNQIVAIDELIGKDALDMAPYAGIVDYIKLKGKLYALPYRSDFWVNYYNKGVFAKAGVPAPGNDMTFDQFRAAAKRITSGTGADTVYGAYVHTWKSCVINWPVADKRGTLIDGKYAFVKPAYDFVLPMQNVDKSIMDFATAKTSSAHYKGQFESGKAGMLLMGTWFIGTLITDKAEGRHTVDWSIAKAAHFPGTPAGTTFGNVTGNAINGLSKNRDAAWKFIKFMGMEEGAKIFARRGVMPAYRTKAVVDAYQSVSGFPPEGKEALNTASVALEFPPHQYAAAIDKALQEEHELIMIGKNSAEQGIAAMDKRVKDIMAGN